MQQTRYARILHTMDRIHKSKQIMPQDLLGRSLAYNCFLPRLSNKTYLYENLQSKTTPKKAIYSDMATIFHALQTSTLQHKGKIDDNIACIVIDDSKENFDVATQDNMLDCFSAMRRLYPAFIVHASVFIDSYQILKSAIAGADMVLFDMRFLREYIFCMHALESQPFLLDCEIQEIATSLVKDSRAIMQQHANEMQKALQGHVENLVGHAYNLGLIPIISPHTKEDLQLIFSLENAPHCLYMQADCIDSNLIESLPKECILFADIITSTIKPDVLIMRQ